MKQITEAARKITDLEVQGATHIAIYGVKQFIDFAKRHEGMEEKEFMKTLFEAQHLLSSARDTEPALRNGLLYILGKIHKDRKEGIDEDIAKMVEIYGNEYLQIMRDSKKHIAKFGSRLIPEDDEDFVIQTHCHSSIVESILIEAANKGKKFKVVSTETRPFYQGRITAKKLTDHGIEVIQVVDSAMRWAAKNLETDLMIIGADAVTSEGTVLNKIGSRLLALVAEEEHIPLFIATPLLKYNPSTLYGSYEKIEMREITEITKDWDEVPNKNLEILNPAFETVNRLLINGLITEAGIFPSSEIHMTFRHYYTFLSEAYTILENEETFF